MATDPRIAELEEVLSGLTETAHAFVWGHPNSPRARNLRFTIEKARAVLAAGGDKPETATAESPCRTNTVWSGICERGTKGCDVKHDGAEEAK